MVVVAGSVAEPWAAAARALTRWAMAAARLLLSLLQGLLHPDCSLLQPSILHSQVWMGCAAVVQTWRRSEAATKDLPHARKPAEQNTATVSQQSRLRGARWPSALGGGPASMIIALQARAPCVTTTTTEQRQSTAAQARSEASEKRRSQCRGAQRAADAQPHGICDRNPSPQAPPNENRSCSEKGGTRLISVASAGTKTATCASPLCAHLGEPHFRVCGVQRMGRHALHCCLV